MKLNKLFTLALISLLSIGATAQNKADFSLSDYTYTANREKVATILLPAGTDVTKIQLAGADAAAFKIVGGNTLILKKGALKKNPKMLNVAITVTEKGEAITQSFKLMLDEFNRNKVIAHRGAWKGAALPHNSIASLNRAIALNCFGSEFDVQLSADSVLYVNHDADIQGHTIEKTTSDVLDQLKLSNGEVLPRLAAYLKAGMAQNKTKLILELKPSVISPERGILLAHKVMDMVRAMHAEAWIDYISFDYGICKEIVQTLPAAKVAYLRSDKAPEVLKQDNINGFDYHYSVLKKNPDWIAKAAQLKIETNAWTVNEPADMDWLLQQKIDYITTDEPETLLQKVK